MANMLIPFSMFAQNTFKKIKIKMEGDLDDDLIIIKASPDNWEFECCYQMHNPTNIFTLEGKTTKSIHAPGWIEYEDNIALKDNEVLLIGLANEREERENTKELLARTHYKSVELYADNKVLIPRMIPEKGDLPDVPTWYHPRSANAAYNYYRAWENALVNIGLIFPKRGLYKIYLLNKKEEIVANQSFYIDENPKNIKFNKTIYAKIGDHPMTEIDGGVYDVDGLNMPNDEIVKELVPYGVLIEDISGKLTKIPFPYPFPYINRMFCKSI
jgi:hypothetical protein